MKNKISEYKKRVNPRIAKDISSIIKPYWQLINKSSDYYKLRSIGIGIGKINIKVKKDVEVLLDAFKDAAYDKIRKKIQLLHGNNKIKDYNPRSIRKFLKDHKIDNIYYSILFNAIYGKMTVNLGLEDFHLITKNAKKAKFYSCEINPIEDADILLKPKLKGMKHAILIFTGNNETTLDDLQYVWDNALEYLPKDGKTTFAYKIDDVNKLKLNLMAVK